MIWASDASGAEAAVAGAAEEAAGVGRPTSAIENPGPTGPLSASTVAPIGWGAAAAGLDDGAGAIGIASCRERVCHNVSISVVAVPLKKKISTYNYTFHVTININVYI